MTKASIERPVGGAQAPTGKMPMMHQGWFSTSPSLRNEHLHKQPATSSVWAVGTLFRRTRDTLVPHFLEVICFLCRVLYRTIAASMALNTVIPTQTLVAHANSPGPRSPLSHRCLRALGGHSRRRTRTCRALGSYRHRHPVRCPSSPTCPVAAARDCTSSIIHAIALEPLPAQGTRRGVGAWARRAPVISHARAVPTRRLSCTVPSCKSGAHRCRWGAPRVREQHRRC
ncbi:hypothetical protein DENSPDRAFT_261319 [Dentipellis sp. KUC8613]|nr:hypothetical protein DENSPDRAFT_261319 [Dentipellis sp. KUC8613]